MIRALCEGDAEAYVILRRAALLDAPLTFASSPEDDPASSIETVREQLRRAPEAVTFGAFQPGLVGAVGLMRDRHLKAAHRANIWGMYVVPEQRRKGLAAALLEAALGHVRAMTGVSWVQLGVSSAAPEARRLYERAGFQVWGGEEDRTLESWRRMYWSYLVSECQRIGRVPNPSAPLVMERFDVVYAEALR